MDDQSFGCSILIHSLVSLGALILWAYVCATGAVPLNVVWEVLLGIAWLIFIGLVYIPNAWLLFSLVGLGVLVAWAIVCGKGLVQLDGIWEILLGVAWLVYIGAGDIVGVQISSN